MMPPTTLFSMHAGFTPDKLAAVFPPTVEELAAGIEEYRGKRGYEAFRSYRYDIPEQLLMGEQFEVEGTDWRVKNVKVHRIVDPIQSEKVGDVEMNSRLLIAPIAAAVAAYPYAGKGGKDNAKEVKTKADGMATEAMRAALNRRSIRGEIRGGEGGGRDGMTRSGALYLGEPVGTGFGMPVHFLVDPLEVTNATKALDRRGAYGEVGHGWSPELVDPAKWFPGYSGASSLMLAVNGNGGTRQLSDFLYLDKIQLPLAAHRHFAEFGKTLTSAPEDIADAISAALRLPHADLRVAALARSRHMTTMKGWMNAGVEPWNIFTPSDGDAMFTPAIAAGALHFAGLTGGVMEGVISAAMGIPMGIRTYMQFVSHDRLGEHKEQADLMNLEHRFGFSEDEYSEMELTRLFDSEHIGHMLRNINQRGELASHIKNAAARLNTDGLMPDDVYVAFLERYEKIVNGSNDGVRFKDEERTFLRQVLTESKYLDVRRILGFGDIVKSRDWLVGVSAITPSRWAPIEGIRGDDGKLVVDTLVAGGSNAVYILETAVERI
jgi:fructose-1,6-bisphosphatase/sedoheptulose 1,7-bisphosphatase-like protein